MTAISRFTIHDELSAPEGSVPVLRGAIATAGQLPNFLGVLAGSPAALRGYARFRSELRQGSLDARTLERISLAVAEHHGSEPGHRDAHALGARWRACGSTRSPRRASSSPRRARGRAAALPQALVEEQGRPPAHLHEEAREAGWTDEQLLEAIAFVALETFTAMVNVAGEVPVDGSTEQGRLMAA